MRATLKHLEQEGWLTSQQRRQGNRNGSKSYQLDVLKLSSAAARFTDFQTPGFEVCNSDTSESDPSKNLVSEGFDPPDSIGDPLEDSKQDPPNSKIPLTPEIESNFHSPEKLEQAQRALSYFNEHTQSEFPQNRVNLRLLSSRLSEYLEEEVILVINFSFARWSKDPKMCDYLRPKTLFKSENFSDYLELAKKWKISGCPENRDGKWLLANPCAADSTARDAAYHRFISGVQSSQPVTELEKLVGREASKLGINKMRSDSAFNAWVRAWKECSQNLHQFK